MWHVTSSLSSQTRIKNGVKSGMQSSEPERRFYGDINRACKPRNGFIVKASGKMFEDIFFYGTNSNKI